jgi:hypothetical protein
MANRWDERKRIEFNHTFLMQESGKVGKDVEQTTSYIIRENTERRKFKIETMRLPAKGFQPALIHDSLQDAEKYLDRLHPGWVKTGTDLTPGS